MFKLVLCQVNPVFLIAARLISDLKIIKPMWQYTPTAWQCQKAIAMIPSSYSSASHCAQTVVRSLEY